jgi:hypothetical protein
VDFEDDAQLDASQVEDSRGGGGLPFGGMAFGGGAVGIVGLIVALIFGINPGHIVGGGGTGSAPPSGNLSSKCRTGADADQSEDCRIVGVVNSVQKYWKQEFADSGRDYSIAPTRLFSGSTSTACGSATAEVGPFYCPGDKRVYLDLGFFTELHDKFGAKGGPFAQAYVIAHEYGHHVQDSLGTMRKVGDSRQGASSGSVRLELQADCYAGVWAHSTYTRGLLEPGDLDEALQAAATVGDDFLQKAATGSVQPEQWTHGSSAQRQKWLTIGYDQGEPSACDTFSVKNP